MRFSAVLFVLLSAAQDNGPAGINARLLRQPDVSSTHIAFVYAGDVWVVPKTGGAASRLTSAAGEESFPRFSPDGATLGFSGNYDGNVDVYAMPVAGGDPRRITYHPAADRMIDWSPDGKSILFASPREGSGRLLQLFLVPRQGGFPERLPVPYGDTGALSPDGKTLAYLPNSVDFRTWKRYRGGLAPDVWIFDLDRKTSKNITQGDANESSPMWYGSILLYLSDRGENKRSNLWSFDTASGKTRQLTFFDRFDVRFPAVGPSDVVFECGGRLYLLDLATINESRPACREVKVTVATDQATLRPRTEKAADLVQTVNVSPGGKRAVVGARGDIFTVPADRGVVRNLTRTPGVFERFPVWSPDGKSIAYFSDTSGEYELTIRAADGTGEETPLTSLGAGFRYEPMWSPDSKKIVFIDQAMRVHLHDLDANKTSVIDKGLWMYHGNLSGFRVSFSADSRWIAWSRGVENRNDAVFLYDTKNGSKHQVTSAFYGDSSPEFDPEGKYLYYFSRRSLSPSYGDLLGGWIYANTTQIMAVPLRADVPSPMAPRNDEEEPAPAAPPKRNAQAPESPKPPAAVEIDLADLERRAVILPPPAGNYANLRAIAGKILFRRTTRTGAADGDTPLAAYDLKEREEKVILAACDGFDVAAGGKKLLVRRARAYDIIDPAPGAKMDKPLAIAELETVVDPRAEWKQMFVDAWRIERDFFYDPGMHGVNWTDVREKYAALLDDAVTRWDVNFLLGELIAELNASHTYRRGGDTDEAETRGAGLLGVDFILHEGSYRILRIVDGAAWDAEARSPLKGLAKEGDYLLAVNGVPIDESKDPWAALQGLAGKTIQLTINDKPAAEGARTILVETLRSEARLRYLAWVEENRRKVEEASRGRIGYAYVPNTGRDGQTELVRQLRAQFNKDALIIDERWNGGGQIPDRFIEVLNRVPYNYWGVRDGVDWQTPSIAHAGPKCMLINGASGSGGDAFPYYFRKVGLGPLIGTRTWGGLIGMTGAPALMDGGSVTVPTFGIYDTEGKWIIEGRGVEPDIEVVADPAKMHDGGDPQLERAIREMMQALENAAPKKPNKPEYPNRSK